MNPVTAANIAFDTFSFVMLSFVIIYKYIITDVMTKTSRYFILLCSSLMLRILGDIIGYLSDGKATEAAYIGNRIGIGMLFIAGYITAAITTLFIKSYISERVKTSRAWLIQVFIITAIAIIITLFTYLNGMIYCFNSSNEYTRGHLYALSHILPSIVFVVNSIYICIYKKYIFKNEKYILLVFNFIPLIAAFIQYFTFNLCVLNSITVVGCIFAFETLQMKQMDIEKKEKENYYNELEVICKSYASIFHWNPDTGKMEISVAVQDYAFELDNGCLLIDKLLEKGVHPDYRKMVCEFLSDEHIRSLEALPEKAVREIEIRDGVYPDQWKRLTLIHIPAGSGKHAELYLTVFDITYEKNLLEKSHNLTKRFMHTSESIFRSIVECKFEDDSARYLVFRNGSIEEDKKIDGWIKMIDDMLHNEIYSDDRSKCLCLMPSEIRKMSPGDSVSCTYRSNRTGEYLWYTTIVRAVSEDDGSISVLYMTRDADKEIKEREKLRNIGERDGLTDLYNRKKLEQMINEEYTGLSSCGVMFFDLNYLKKTNDTYGHDAGDELLCRMADSVRSITSKRIHGYRIGGDEFVVVVCNCGESELSALICLWKARLDQLNAGSNPQCSVAVGMAWASKNIAIETLIKQADIEMYKDKVMKKALRE